MDFQYYDFLLIDKCDDFHYFKSLKDLAKYIDKTIPQARSIQVNCKKHLNWRHKNSGYYIQRLFNNTSCHNQNKDSEIFIFDDAKRINMLKANSYWNKSIQI